MIKIVYRPEYDEEIFLGDRPRVMGTEYLGTKGLLQKLGLRLGIPTNAKVDVEREADYHNASKSILAVHILIMRPVSIPLAWHRNCYIGATTC